jgi:WD40 repeat protein
MIPLIASWPAVQGPVRAIDFVRHEAGVALAVVGSGGEVRLFTPEGGHVVREEGSRAVLPAPPGAPAYDLVHVRRPTGWPHIATVGGDHTVRVYDPLTGGLDFTRTLPVSDELGVVESFLEPEGTTTIAAAGLADNVYLWRGGVRRHTPLPGHIGPIRAMKALRLERWLAVADERSVVMWDLSRPRPTQMSRYPGSSSRSLAVVREHGEVRMVSAGTDGIHLWDPFTGREMVHFARQLRVAAVAAVEAEDDEDLLAVAAEGTVTLWSPRTEALSRSQLAGVPPGGIRVLAKILTGNGTLLAAGSSSGEVAVWRLVPQRRSANLVGRHKDWVNSLAVVGAARRQLLASTSDDRSVRFWQVSNARRYGAPAGVITRPTQVQAVAAIGGDLATGDQHGWVHRWSPDGRERWRAHAPYGAVRTMTSYETAGGWRIVSAGASGHCLLWDADTGKVLRPLRPAPGSGDGAGAAAVRAVAAAERDGRWYVAAGDLSGKIDVWDAATGEPYWTIPDAHRTQVRSLAVLPRNGRPVLASGGSAGTIRLWDLADKRRLRETGSGHGHTGQVGALCAVRAGPAWLLASGGADGAILLWDPDDVARPVSRVPTAHDGFVRALAQIAAPHDDESEDGETTQVASGGEDGSIRLWQVRDRQLVRSTHAPSIRGFRDRLARLDLLDRRELVDELHELLRPDPGQPGTAPVGGTGGPQVVLIQGAWGTGKSSLMRDLRARLEEQEAATAPARWLHGRGTPRGVRHRLVGWWRGRELTPRRANRFVRTGTPPRVTDQPVRRTATAWFNPWAHQSSAQVWSGLAWSIVDATRDELGARVAARQHYWLHRNLPRLDRGGIRRTLRQRLWRPTLTTGAALIVPITVALVRLRSSTGSSTGSSIEASLLDNYDRAAQVLTAGGSAVLAVLAGYALLQYLFGKVTAYLPADMFDGPVGHESLATVTGERLVRDLPYAGSAGELHRINRDIHKLVKDLEERGYQLVVFIDDLDRCTQANTAEVFEAINAFVSDQNFPDCSPRFVLGLDLNVVAERLSDAYAGSGRTPPPADADDPGSGWSILRKLSQLTVVLPGIPRAHTARLLRHHSMPVPADGAPRSRPANGRPAAGPGPTRPATAAGSSAGSEERRPRPARWRLAGRQTPVPAPVPEAQVVALEGEPEVQVHLQKLISLRPRQTMRETKRLLTQWGFHMGLLERLLPRDTMTNVQAACDAMTLAEIVRRWPAFLRHLGRVDDGPSGLATLVRAVQDGAAGPAAPGWQDALRALRLDDPRYSHAMDNLHWLLAAHGTTAVAGFADLLL